VPHFNLDVVSAAEAREELEFFYEELASMSPEIIGGELPDDTFYYRADE
jgi:NitT/TauT family transport system substrate-binding protein